MYGASIASACAAKTQLMIGAATAAVPATVSLLVTLCLSVPNRWSRRVGLPCLLLPHYPLLAALTAC